MSQAERQLQQAEMAYASRGSAATSSATGAPSALGDFVDLDRYPLHALDSAAGRALIEDARQQMATRTLCLLEGFLRPAALAAIRAELTAAASAARRLDYQCTAYAWRDNGEFPAEHPRGALFRRCCDVLTTEQLRVDGPSHRLYACDALTEFVRRLLGYETLYRSACPTLAIQVNVMHEGDTFGWHFDTNDGVISLVIDAADVGGEFEFAPLIRAEDDENYAGVQRVMNGRDAPASPPQPPGTFSLFFGRRSVHRVAPVGPTLRPRISLLLSYDRSPGQVFPAGVRRRFLDPVPTPHHGASGVDG